MLPHSPLIVFDLQVRLVVVVVLVVVTKDAHVHASCAHRGLICSVPWQAYVSLTCWAQP